MAVQTSYPGVYVTELPSGVRTITGAATSVTAFVGRTLRGPVNRATIINSLADYERVFGGLWKHSTVSFAVRDFFANGGGQAVVVRLVSTGDTDKAKPAQLTLRATPPTREGTTETPGSQQFLVLRAVDEGEWANNLTVTVDHSTSRNITKDVAAQLNVKPEDLFNLVVTLGDKGPQEVFRNITQIGRAHV